MSVETANTVSYIIDTPTPITQAAETWNTKSNNAQVGRGEQTRRNNHRRRNVENLINSMAKDFTGDTPELGEVMNLSSEKLDNGMAFDKFWKNLKIYMLNIYDTLKMSCILQWILRILHRFLRANIYRKISQKRKKRKLQNTKCWKCFSRHF